MIPARAPRDRRAGKLLTLAVARASIEDHPVLELPALLDPGDLLIVNDAATLPASLAGHAGRAPIELRLLGQDVDGSWRAVLFGAGDWTTPTERRPPPPALAAGARLELGELIAHIESVAPESARLVRVRFEAEGARFWSALYRSGKPVQYSYLTRRLELWDVQTSYAARPWAAEAPSAGFPLTGGVLGELRRRGVEIAALTHAAGLSSTGDAAIDALLPLAERSDISSSTVSAIARARARGARVIATGTTVVRALEGRALEGDGQLRAGTGETTLRLGPGYRRKVVDGLLSGMHEPEESHYALLQAFAPRALLDRARRAAEAWGYRGHELGDAMLILP